MTGTLPDPTLLQAACLSILKGRLIQQTFTCGEVFKTVYKQEMETTSNT